MDQIKAIAIPASSFIGNAPAAHPAGAAPSGGFINSLQSAISKANDIEIQANQATEALMTGQTQNIHQTMVALQEADVSFQLMMQIRNKILSAYDEIQRMQI
jgi:flagellar hook-basal body complex protein FliE